MMPADDATIEEQAAESEVAKYVAGRR